MILVVTDNDHTGISRSPLGCNALHGPPHEGITLKDRVEVVDVEREHVAVGLRTHTSHPPDDDDDDGDGE